jgi:acetyltransferase-like isoleucine patch superfamily enzyme
MIKFIHNMITSYFWRKNLINKWRANNQHNSTRLEIIPDEISFFDRVKVGKGTYGSIKALYSNHPKEFLKIGNYCSIGSGTTFMLGSEHPHSYISTFPFKVKILKVGYEATTKGPIELCDDVWIGENVLILSGVTIGQGAVVAAGAIVTKDVPPYSIVGGNPARLIKYRFSEEVIKVLCKIDYEKLDATTITLNIDLLYQNINEGNVNEIVRKLGLDN